MRKFWLILILLAVSGAISEAVMPDFLDFLNDAQSVRSRSVAEFGLFDEDVLAAPAKVSLPVGLNVSSFYAQRFWGVGLFSVGVLYGRPDYYLGGGFLNLNAGSEEFSLMRVLGEDLQTFERQVENNILLRTVFGYRQKLPLPTSFGIAVNYLYSVLFADYKYNALTFDIAGTVNIFPSLWLAGELKNVTGVSGNYQSGGVAVSSQSFALPASASLGLFYQWAGLNTFLSGNYSFSRKEYFLGLGLEYSLNYTQIYPLQKAQIRLGWQYNPQSVIDISNFSLGFGIGYQRMSLDYAFVPHPYLGASHYLSVGYRFGGPSEQASFSGRLLDRFLLIYSSATKTFDEIGFNRLEDWVKVINENKFYRIKIVGTPEINEAVESFLINAENVSESKISFEVKYQPPLDTGEILIYGP